MKDQVTHCELGENRQTYITTNIPPGVTEGCFGCVEVIDETEGIRGWAWDAAHPHDPLGVSIYLDVHFVGVAYTVEFRADVAAAAEQPIQPGFRLKWQRASLPADIRDRDPESLCEFSFRIEGTDQYLHNLSKRYPTVMEVLKWVGPPQPLRMSESQKKEIVETFLAEEQIEPEVSGDVKAIAFFLPQFHPVPENDQWWGPGFTEWTNVTQAKPLFPGHYQPHMPGELGFYDLRLPEVREAQARLAREHGIYGFCYYYYWFAGRRILERPLDDFLGSGKPDFPFCICWANESWSRRWDGSENEVLLKQEHTMENDIAFIRDVIPILKDPRYIRVNGAPLLLIYRASLFEDPERTCEIWRKRCAEEGIPSIHLSAVEFTGFNDPYAAGFDSSVEFPPLNINPNSITDEIAGLPSDFAGGVYDYEEYSAQVLMRDPVPYKRFRGVMTGWDNSPRRKKGGYLFINSSPENYEVWLRGAVDYTKTHHVPAERLVFINAWNEWAEGAHLEPDLKHGRGFLEATRRALAGTSDWRTLIHLARTVESLSGHQLGEWLHSIECQFLAQERSLRYLRKMCSVQMGSSFRRAVFSSLKPSFLDRFATTQGGNGRIESINGRVYRYDCVLDRTTHAGISGWCFAEGGVLEPHSSTTFLLEDIRQHTRYYATVFDRQVRDDVAKLFPDLDHQATQNAGFQFYADLSQVEPGEYQLGVVHRMEHANIEYLFRGVIQIV